MRAMQLAAPAGASQAPLRLVEMPVPAPRPGQVLLRVQACGVCRTDLHILEGELPLHRAPLVPGHQIVGEVVAFGAGADGISPGGEPGLAPLRIGDRVGVPWLHQTDGTCRFCRRGDENLCERAVFTGYDVDGGFAEYTVAPAGWVYRLPTGMSDLAAAPLLCAGIIGYRCLRLVGVVGEGAWLPGRPSGWPSTDSPVEVSETRRLGIYGFGSAAHLCTQVARWRGWEVYAFTRGQEHRSLALELGAAWAGETSGDPGALLDAAVVFAPAGELAVAALRRLDRGGIVAIGRNPQHAHPGRAVPVDLSGASRSQCRQLDASRCPRAPARRSRHTRAQPGAGVRSHARQPGAPRYQGGPGARIGSAAGGAERMSVTGGALHGERHMPRTSDTPVVAWQWCMREARPRRQQPHMQSKSA